MIFHALILIVLLLPGALAGCSSANPATPVRSPLVETPGPGEKAAAEVRYFDLVGRIKEDPKPALVRELREVFVTTDRYRPYAGQAEAYTTPMFEEIDEKHWGRCLELAASALDVDYTDMWAHFGAMICNREAGDDKLSAFHETVAGELVDAIWTTGNGKTRESAFRTNSTSELQAFLGLQGLEIDGEALSEEAGGRRYDVVSAHDPKTGRDLTLYFDVTMQWSLLLAGPGAETADSPDADQ